MKVIKKGFKYPCYYCRSSIRGTTVQRKKCTVCNGTGFFKDEIYYHIITDKKGNKICFEGDTIK